jgi:hypothetical protein
MGLSGFTHISGIAGSGKTMLAIAIAADASRMSQVEWINTDSKTRFIPHLKATVTYFGGVERNVSVTMADGHKQALETVLSLPMILTPCTSLVVVDPITRVIDMARTDPVLWGQELLEEALPTLAALAKNREIDIIVMSEMRTIPEVGDLPVYSKAISKWADKTVKLCLDSSGKSSSVFIEEDGDYREIAHLEVLEDGACHLSLSHHKGVTQNCLEKEF